MTVDKSLFRKIPKTDDILRQAAILRLEESIPHTLVMEQVRKCLDRLRQEILDGTRTTVPGAEELADRTAEAIQQASRMSLRKVINATGVVLHTNLGRAKLCPEAVEAVEEVVQGYSNLEFNLDTGRRGSRYDHVEELLCRLTGAESAMVVNNNAAAVLLILGAMTQGKEVVVSRGELVEIGGSFRVPEIMEYSGSILREVGTTNKTHIWDYERAIRPEVTGALLKVHTSNYRITGFTESVELADMVKVGRTHQVPVIYDVGSGAMLDFTPYHLMDEPTVADCVRQGADVVSFSGDKLLGGPQAGIIVGRKEYIDKMKQHPLTRAFRVDKMTLAALEATLMVYRDMDKAKTTIPTLDMLLAGEKKLEERSQALCELLIRHLPNLKAQVIRENGQVGGGSMPGQLLPGFAVAVELPEGISLERLEGELRRCQPALVGRVAHDRFLLDVRTMEDGEFEGAVRAMETSLDRITK